MAYYGIVDFGVHFHVFRNIDLLYQGLYQIRVRVYCDLANEGSSTTSATLKKVGYPRGSDTNLTFQYEREKMRCIAGLPYGYTSGNSDLSGASCLASLSCDSRNPTDGYCRDNKDCRVSSVNRKSYTERPHFTHPTLDAEEQCYKTSSFFIRVPDEEIELNEFCQFRLELDLCQEGALSAPMYLEVDLLYSNRIVSDTNQDLEEQYKVTSDPSRGSSKSNGEASVLQLPVLRTNDTMRNELHSGDLSVTGVKPDSPPITCIDESLLWNVEFHSVAYQIYRINNVCQGLHQFFPVIFDEYHFSLCSISIHTSLIDIRSRLTPNFSYCVYWPRFRNKKPASSPNYDMVEEELCFEDAYALTQGGYRKASEYKISDVQHISTFIDFLNNAHKGLGEFASSIVSVASESRRRRDIKYATEDKDSKDKTKLPCEGTDTALASGVVHSDPLLQSRSYFLTSLSPTVTRAEELHIDYMAVILECLCKTYFFSRVIHCRCFSPAERKILAAVIQFHPLSLPGDDRVFLPGVEDSSVKDIYLLKKKHEARREKQLPNNTEASGKCAYSEADLLHVYIRIDKENLFVEIHRIKEDNDYEMTREERELLSKMQSVELIAHMPCLTSRLSSVEHSSIASLMTSDFQHVSVQLMTLWQQLCNVLLLGHREIMYILRYEYQQRCSDFWKECIIRENMGEEEIVYPSERSLWDVHQNIANEIRKSMRHPYYQSTAITDIFLVPTADSRPIIFEQRYHKKNAVMSSGDTKEHLSLSEDSTPRRKTVGSSITLDGSGLVKGFHCMVLVHGFQGNAYDVRLLRNMLRALYPSMIFLCSSTNEMNTEGCIKTMGRRLANEIMSFLQDNFLLNYINRLSFLSHSLGGVIVRAALPYLKDMWDKLYTFISFSTPHLGYMYSSNRLVEAGIWFLQKWRRGIALEQLTLSDAKCIQETFLYTLSNSSEALQYFHHFCLVSSHQDKYVPFESARIEMSVRAEKDVKLGKAYLEMAENILARIHPHRLRRFNVNFNSFQRNLDTLIGRTAHIQFLEDTTLMRLFFETYTELFAC